MEQVLNHELRKWQLKNTSFKAMLRCSEEETQDEARFAVGIHGQADVKIQGRSYQGLVLKGSTLQAEIIFYYSGRTIMLVAQHLQRKLLAPNGRISASLRNHDRSVNLDRMTVSHD